MIRILITDDDPFIRESLKLILNMQEGMEVVGVCGDGQEAYQFLQQNGTVDVVLMDIRMMPCNGVEGTRLIKQQWPEQKVLILTTFDDDEYIVEALKHGANGYLLKNISPEQITAGIQTVYQGHLLIHPQIAKKLPMFLSEPAATPKHRANLLDKYALSANELAIISHIASGHSNKEIAQALYLSEGTVKNYITEILNKLELRDRTQIAIFYLTKLS